ncbi:BT_3928 family protein [Bacteroidota bacterium]
MKHLKTISRLIVGLVFLFSGFVKIIDPLGTAYKFDEYFIAFNLDFLAPISFPLALLMCGAEFLIGFCLFFNIRTKISAWAVLIFMSFFTVLTFILAIKNNVSDCGCFGDAIILSNWGTFFKNIIIMLFVLVIFFNRSEFKGLYSKKIEYLIVFGFTILTFGFELYNYNHLPIIDFRPYKVGNYLPGLMESPAPDVSVKYKNKDGETREFSIDNLPSSDSGWEWVETISSEAEIPPVHDFEIINPAGERLSEYVLENKSYTFLLIANRLNKTNTKCQTELNRIAKYCDGYNYDFLCLTSSNENEINEFINTYDPQYAFYNTDGITLKTIIRSNPGLVILKEGTVIAKWHYNDLPTEDDLVNLLK